jgi:hypothetical protein
MALSQAGAVGPGATRVEPAVPFVVGIFICSFSGRCPPLSVWLTELATTGEAGRPSPAAALGLSTLGRGGRAAVSTSSGKAAGQRLAPGLARTLRSMLLRIAEPGLKAL